MNEQGVAQTVTDAIQDPTTVTKQVGALRSYFESQIPSAIGFAVNVVLAIILFIIGRWVIRLIDKGIQRHMARAQADEGLKRFISSLTKVLLYALLIFLIATRIGIASSSVAALLASSGVAIGLAMQGSLSNFAGGVLILLLKPFRIGDYIIEHNNGNEGTVTEISIIYTRMLTVDNRTVIIPNGMLSNTSLTNVTERPERQLDMSVTVDYQADVSIVKALLVEELNRPATILDDRGSNVFVRELNANGIVFGLRAWVKTNDFLITQCSILEAIKNRFDAEGIQIPGQVVRLQAPLK